MKLIAEEPESAGLTSLVSRFPERISSAIAVVEVGRAVRRSATSPAWEDRIVAILGTISLVSVDRQILERATRIEPTSLLSLDAIHLATALTFGEDLEALVTYDRRLLAAANQLGLRAVAPS